jgi:nucleoside 2-deoxyribosyltransferase
MNPLTIYVAGLMSGLPFREVKERFYPLIKELQDAGFFVLHPMIGKENHFKDDTILKQTFDHPSPMTTDKAILRRDHWMVKTSDIVLMNLLHAKEKSIGCSYELAWAYCYNRHVITLMEKGNCHEHAFVKGGSDIILTNTEDAIKYLKEFSEIWRKE